MASPPISVGGGVNSAREAGEIVRSQINEMSQRAETALATAQTVISGLASYSAPPVPEGPAAENIDTSSYVVPAPTSPRPMVPSGLVENIDTPADLQIGDIASLLGDLGDLDSELGDVGQFEPAFDSIAIPNAPAPIDTSGAPNAPAISDVAIPDAPSFQLPVLDALDAITVPTFTFPTLPTFDGVPPEFDGELPTVSALANWEEPEYAPEILPDVLVTVRRMLDGQTGLPPQIEQALYERTRDRENLTARASTQEAFDTWAGRGFDMPPGMLVEQVNAAQEQAQLRINAADREIAIEVARIAVENVRQAVAQGIAAEQVLANIFNNAVQRSFEMARLRLESEIRLYDMQVSLFNAKQTAYQVAAQVFEARLRAELASLEVYKAQIEGAKAIADLNEAKVRIYAAKVDGLKAAVDIYRTQMEGARVQSELNQSRIGVYRASVEAYAAGIQARKSEFDAYEAQVRGEAAKVGIIQAQADAFAATVRAIEGKANVKVAKVNATVNALQARVQEFSAKAGYEREKVSAQAQVANAKVGAFSADVQRFAAELQASTSANEAQIRSTDVMLRTKLAQYEISVKRYDTAMQQLIQQAAIQMDAIKAAGQMASQLAAGAMSAMHVQASVSGSGSQSYSENRSDNVTYSTEF